MAPLTEPTRIGRTESIVSSTATREMLSLAEQAAEGKIRALPAKEWSLHYPVDAAQRTEKLQGLLDKRYNATEVAQDLTPDALLYSVDDIQTEGLEKVSARIRDISAYIAHYDYPRFAQFIESMRGYAIPLNDLVRLYSDVTQTRVQKKLMDAYGHTGRAHITASLTAETIAIAGNIEDSPRLQRVLKALKIDWLSEHMAIVSKDQRDQILAKLSGDERKLFDKLQPSYQQYVQTGSEVGYIQLLDAVRAGLPQLKPKIAQDEPSQSMQQLQKELEQFTEQTVPPGAPNDPAIPPDDQDEYHTPPPTGGETGEQQHQQTIFEIKPPLAGSYASGRKSFFDIDTKTWSKHKQLSPYTTSSLGVQRWTIQGALGTGCKSLPLPNGYALDSASLTYTGSRPEILRDETGCFYLQAQGSGTFSIEFGQETNLYGRGPIAEDTTPLYRGKLSQKTEAAIARFGGSNAAIAEQARQYLLANHFYPGGGDLQLAQALQYKLRTESTGDTYLQNIDASEYLECYSANTKFIAMVRAAGVPARLVVGHKVEGSKNDVSAITQNTGHAWSEIWDGLAWRRFDATPSPKPEDIQKPDSRDQDSKKEFAPEADDGGVESPSSASASSQIIDQQDANVPTSPLDQLSTASDSQLEQSASQLTQAQEQLKQMQQQKQQLSDKLESATTFKELTELNKEVATSELFKDFKEELQEKLAAKEDQIKDTMKDQLDTLVEDGFLDQQRREQMIQQLEQNQLTELDRIQKEIERESRLHNQFEDIRAEVTPLVEQWFRHFYEQLPPNEEVGVDTDSLTRQGNYDHKAAMTPRNLITGTVKHPREIIASIEPRFMATILVDVSGSMAGEKLQSARKLLVFYSELFSRISERFGYIRFSINTFSDSVTSIKSFSQEYDSSERYDHPDGTHSSVKVRLMQEVKTQGGTNMLEGIKQASQALNQEVADYPGYASALYFFGDGGDTCGNTNNIKQFVQLSDPEHGFGTHMYSAILLGNESQRGELARIFGDDHTAVAPSFDELIERSMEQFEEDIVQYLSNR